MKKSRSEEKIELTRLIIIYNMVNKLKIKYKVIENRKITILILTLAAFFFEG
jgi:hypothetical protein